MYRFDDEEVMCLRAESELSNFGRLEGVDNREGPDDSSNHFRSVKDQAPAIWQRDWATVTMHVLGDMDMGGRSRPRKAIQPLNAAVHSVSKNAAQNGEENPSPKLFER